MTDIDITRVDTPRTGTERELLDGFLDFHRATLLGKCAGLTDDQLRSRPIDSTDLSLLGLVRHLTDVENGWFAKFGGRPHERRYDAAGNGFDGVEDADVAEAVAAYRAEVERSRATAAARGLDDDIVNRDGVAHSLRWVLLHMIEEYARHNGHADLLRQRIDGATGV
jgi:uncharacterized damage-inducible protein DinB